MIKKLLLFSLLLALVMPWAAQAQTTVTIGDGTSSDYYTPIGTYYNYSITEQLYTADEIGMAGTISSISFYYAGTAAKDLPITVYMANVDAENLSTGISLADADVVFEGTYSVTGAGWATIELNTPFAYDGTSSLLIGINKSYLKWYSGGNWNHTATEAVMTRYSNNDNSAYTTTAVPASTTTSRPNIQMVITASGTPVCYKPALAVSEITHNQATLTIGGGSGTYNVQYKLASATTWTNVASNSTNTTFTLSGLTPLTAYDVQAQSVCDGSATSDWKTASFSTTAQAEIVGNAWSDDFEGTTCSWELVNNATGNNWAWGTAASNGGTHGLYISNDGGTTNAYTYNSAAMVYATKFLNFTEGKFEFAFNWMANGEANWDFLRVALVPASVTLTAGTTLLAGLTSSAVPSGWIALDGGSQLKGVTDWQNQSVTVNVPTGNYYMVLAWRNDGSGGNQPPAAVDNVSITRVACGYDVEGLAVDNVTTNSATLTWTAGEAEQWQVAFADNGNFDNATEAIVSEATYNFTGLQPATRYYAKVRAYCGGEDFGSWSNVIEILTDCAIIPALGFTENFDSYTAAAGVLPICWNKINTTTYSSYQGYPRIYNYTSQSSPNCLYFYSYYSSSYSYYDPQDQYAILPEMENLAGKLITLSAKANSNTVTFKIGLMTDPTDAATFTEMATQALTTSYQEFQYIVPADATAHYIAIMLEAANSSSTTRYIYVDDITITEAPTCFKPTGLTYSNVYGHGATLSWLLNDETQTAWDVQVSDTVDFSRIVALVENVDNHENYVLSGLDPETHYYVRVRSNCGGGDVSDWSNTVNFTTTVACPAPTGFAATELSGYTATLNWTGYSENYTVSYRTAATSIGFFEAFHTSGIPAGWTQYSGLVDGVLADTIELTSGSNWGTSSYGLGAYNAKLNIYGSSRKNWLVTPEVTLESGYNLDFDLALTDYGNSNPIEHDTLQADDRFVVLIYADEAWTILREWNNTGSEYVYNTIATTGEHVSINLAAYVGKTVKIAFYGESTADGGDNDMHIDNVSIGIPVPDGEWQTVTVDEAPVILTDLTPKTYYDAKVQGDCGDDGLSLESSVITFTTLETCPTPTGLAVVDSLLTATSAGLRWNGSIDVDSYTVRYRVAEHTEGGLNEEFGTSIPTGWELYTGLLSNVMDGEALTPATYGWSFGAANGVFDNHARVNIYGNSQRWLITPAVTLASSTFTFDLALTAYTGTNVPAPAATGTDDKFVVLISTDNDATWTILRQWDNEEGSEYVYNNIANTAEGEQVSIDLSAYVGQKVRVAFYGESTVSNADNNLHIDNVVIGNPTVVPAGEWQTASSATTNVTLTGLTPETPYEAQVKSDCSDLEAWSDMVTFTTLEEPPTYTLTINGYQDDTNEGGYYLIASPVTVDLTNHEMTTGDFDLYSFDQAEDDEWRNYKTGAFSNLEPGKGYLYAHKIGGDFTLSGTLYDGDGTIELVYDNNAVEFKGWNLVGNPWPVKAYPNHDFYTMNNDGSAIDVTPNVAGTEVNPMTGVFVVAEGEGQTVTFETENPGNKRANLALNLTSSNKLVDRAIVRFGEGRQLPKFQLNPNHTKVYIPQDNKEYAIVNAEEMGEIPVNFKAEKNGTYTFSVSETLNAQRSTLNFQSLHLIDNMTGEDIDLLETPAYTFEAKVTDYASRFRLVFAKGNSTDESFAFYSNGEFIVSGQGTLQIFDALGHQLLSKHLSTLNSHLSISTSPGVYMLRLVNGDNVKVQKVVVR